MAELICLFLHICLQVVVDKAFGNDRIIISGKLRLSVAISTGIFVLKSLVYCLPMSGFGLAVCINPFPHNSDF